MSKQQQARVQFNNTTGFNVWENRFKKIKPIFILVSIPDPDSHILH